MKFKIGDKVIANKMANGRYNITKQGWIGTVYKISSGYITISDNNGYLYPVEEKYFDLLEEKPVKVGDILVDPDGIERKVLEVFENTFVISTNKDFNDVKDLLSFKEIENFGLKVKGQDEKSEWLKKGKDNNWIKDGEIIN